MAPHKKIKTTPLHGLAVLCMALALTACGEKPFIDYSGPTADWAAVGGNDGGLRYSALTQINKNNVTSLEQAWSYSLKDFSATGSDTYGPSALQLTPLVVNGSMYVCTPYNRVISLNPRTGEENWVYDPKVDLTGVYTPLCRGVSYRRNPEIPSEQECATQIFEGTVDARLIAIDAQTGKPCSNFGENGSVDLTRGVGKVLVGEYYMTSPPLIAGNKVVTGAQVKDGQRTDAPSGAIRAWDADTGELLWAWDPVPPTQKAVTADEIKQGQNLTPGTPNAWGLLSADVEKGLIYVPTGNPAPDHFGGEPRDHLDFYGTSVVALDANTGKVAWHFQAVHHDLWDYDMAAQPVVFPKVDGSTGVIAATKLGHLFLLDGQNGKPLLPVEERAVPQTQIEGEYSSPTQPFPVKPRPLHPEKISRDQIWGATPWDKKFCQNFFDSLDYAGAFTPPSHDGILEFPGLGGGINWGSVSVDPEKRRIVVNLQIAPFTIKMVPRKDLKNADGNDLVGLAPQEGTPYAAVRGLFTTPYPDMKPCIEPPWGKLFSIDLDSGDILWERTLGNLNKLAPMGLGKLFNWGTPNTGGSIQTAGGLIFIGATLDHYFRAFDVDTGDVLWEQELPYAAMATPMTYRLTDNDRQYVVIAAGGHGPLGSTPGDQLIAFALPERD